MHLQFFYFLLFIISSVIILRVFRSYSTRIYFILFAFLFVQFLTGQTTINSSDYISEKLKEAASFLSTDPSYSYDAPWIDEVHIRTGTKDFDFEKQGYTLRFSPSSPKIRRARNRLHDVMQQEAATESNEFVYELYMFAYQDWLNIYAIQEELEIYKDLNSLHHDIEKVILKMGTNGELAIKDLTETKRDISETSLQIQTLESSLNTYVAEKKPDFSDLIPIEAIAIWVASPTLNRSIESKRQQELLLKEKKINTEYSLEKAKDSKLIDFFQVEYDGPHSDRLSQRIALGVGFTIVNPKSNLKYVEYEMEKDRLLKEYAVSKKRVAFRLARKLQAILSDIEEYQLRETNFQTQESAIQKLINKQSQGVNATPLLLLYQQIEGKKQGLSLLKSKLSIYEKYIELLIYTEQLYQHPFQNFLKSK